MTARLARVGALAVALTAAAGAARSESGWVRGAPLNLRTGAGDEYRIVGLVQPGEPLEVLERTSDWTRVRTGEGKEGWIPAGYLGADAPPHQRVAQLESEVGKLRAALDETRAEATRLRASQAALTDSDGSRRDELERLTRENAKLRAGTRWAEWLTGALLLSTGMVLGAILSRLAARRGTRRLRL
jgi:SH3 domain protein